MKIEILKRAKVGDLYQNIDKNLDLYMGAGFGGAIASDDTKEVQAVEFDPTAVEKMQPKSGGDTDAQNALVVHSSLEGMTPYLARDERIWAYLTHTHFLPYVRKRWISEDSKDEEKIKAIQIHFFARGSRAFERGNALSSLWWWAHIASRYQDSELEKTAKALLTNTDLRDAIIGRPSTSRSAKVFSAIMHSVMKRNTPEDGGLLDRRVYREWLKKVNMHGGTRLLDGLDEATLRNLIEGLAQEAEQPQSPV